MSEPKYTPPEKFTCSTCVRFQPETVYTHKGREFTAWYGRCGLRSGTFCEETHTCPEWKEKK